MARYREKNAGRAVNGGGGGYVASLRCCRRLVWGLIVQHNVMLCDTMRQDRRGCRCPPRAISCPPVLQRGRVAAAGAASVAGWPPSCHPLQLPAAGGTFCLAGIFYQYRCFNPTIIVGYCTSPPPLSLPHDHPVTGI